MALQDKLNEHKANFEKNAPPEALEVMHRATVDLRNSGILDRALKVGDKAPEFELEKISKHFANKWPSISKLQDIPDVLAQVGPLEIFTRKSASITG